MVGAAQAHQLRGQRPHCRGFISCSPGGTERPHAGGILTIMGSPPSGKHARNIHLPIMAGVLLGGLVMGGQVNPLSACGPLLYYAGPHLPAISGGRWASLAGFLHASVMLHTGIPWRG